MKRKTNRRYNVSRFATVYKKMSKDQRSKKNQERISERTFESISERSFNRIRIVIPGESQERTLGVISDEKTLWEFQKVLWEEFIKIFLEEF